MTERPPTFYNPRNFKINIATFFFGEPGKTLKGIARVTSIVRWCIFLLGAIKTVNIRVKAQKGK
jgi:hypothetical protein